MVNRLVIMSVLLSFSVSAQVQKQTKKIAAPINMHMHNISQNLHKLLPYIISEEKFTEEKNHKEIEKYLKDLLNEFQNIKKHPAIKTPGFSISRSLMEQNLKGVISSYQTNHRDFALYKLNSTFGLCISCHTQLPTGDKLKLFNEDDIEKTVTNLYEQAEFNFITRDFKLAIEKYDQFINHYSENGQELKKLETALNRKLSYYTRIKRGNEKEAISLFKKNLANKNLPKSIHVQIEEWIKELESITPIDKMKDFLKTITKSNSDGPMVNLFSNQEAKDLLISGQLYEYLNFHPNDPLVPEILFNLAVIDKRLNFNIFYSLGDLYLLECIENYSSSPFAKLCYKEYEDETIFSYTGSSGTNIPKSVQNELKRLKHKVGLK